MKIHETPSVAIVDRFRTINGVTIGEQWEHHSGRVYEVIGFANQHTERPDKHPVHVLYRGPGGREWTRPLTEFLQKFSKLTNVPTVSVPDNSLHPATADLIRRFALALSEKLTAAQTKYGYSDGWLSPDWMDECRAKLLEHVAKGDPRDAAAYCAFLWHHGESTASAQDEPVAWMHTSRENSSEGHDEPSYFDYTYIHQNKELADKGSGHIPLYTRPQSDKLRQAAEEALSAIEMVYDTSDNWIHETLYKPMIGLRAALEESK